jgi:hypothetical protein
MRTIIDIPSDRLQSLDRWALSCKISRAEAVRRAVGDFLDRVANPKDTGFGLWVQGKPEGYQIPPERDGLRMQQAMREEWPE